MKIICIANNFLMENKVNEAPVFFLKPDVSIHTNNKPFFIPHFISTLSCSVSPVIRIDKVGKNISEKFAHRYYNEVTAGIDFCDKEKFIECKKNNLPWEAANAFESSAPVGNFYPKSIFNESSASSVSLIINNNKVQEYQIQKLTYTFDFIISFVSQYFTLKSGDLIFLGTPITAVDVHINDQIKVQINNNQILDFLVK